MALGSRILHRLALESTTALAQPSLLLSLVTLPVAPVAQAVLGTHPTGSVSSQSCVSISSPVMHTAPRHDASFSSSFSAQFVFLTYVLGVAWLGVFGFSAVPVFMFYNIWSTCEVIKSPQTNGTAAVEQICVDIRQYGTVSFRFPDEPLASRAGGWTSVITRVALLLTVIGVIRSSVGTAHTLNICSVFWRETSLRLLVVMQIFVVFSSYVVKETF